MAHPQIGSYNHQAGAGVESMGDTKKVMNVIVRKEDGEAGLLGLKL